MKHIAGFLRPLACPGDIVVKFFLLLVVFSCLQPSPASGEGRTVTVGVYENAPKVFTSESGKPAGIFIDIIEQIAKSEGWKLRYVSGTWAEGLERLAKGEIDLMPDVAYTADREKIYSFHKDPVLSVWSQLYAPKGSGIRSILDLSGKRIAALEQTIQLETFKRLTNSFGLKITLIPVPDYKTEFDMLAAGKADAGLTNRFYGLMNARKFGLEDTPIMFDPAPFFFAAAKGDPQGLLNAIDNRLQELKKDSRSAYYGSLKRWTSEEVKFDMPGWLQALGLVVAVVMLMSVGGSFLLKHQVDARTRELKRINQEMEQSIAERKKAEEEAKLSAKLVHFLSKYANDFIILLDDTFHFIEVNERTVDSYGYTYEELIGMHASQLRAPETREDFIAQIKLAQVAEKAVYETIHQRKDGTKFPVEISLRAIASEGKNLYQAVIRDITERKKNEEELEKHRLHLEEMVSKRTAELERSQMAMQHLLVDMSQAKTALEAVNERLKGLDQLKSMFIASMSHELRTPLNSIIGFTGITLQGLSGDLNDEQRDNLSRAYQSGKHLLSLITDVIDISKIEAGRVEAFIEAVSLRKIIAEAVDTVQSQAKEKDLRLQVEIASDVELHTDRKRLLQCLINLLSNGVKYTEQGEVRISVRELAQAVEIVVADTGIGIAEQDLPKLFEAFERLETHLRVKAGGTGLGLYLTKKLATDILRGAVTVRSKEGEGSTFTLHIPKTIALVDPA